jgi:hypothetical protein
MVLRFPWLEYALRRHFVALHDQTRSSPPLAMSEVDREARHGRRLPPEPKTFEEAIRPIVTRMLRF